MYLGIEIGGTKLQLGLGPGDGTLASLWRGQVDPARGGDGIRQQITQAVPQLLSQAGVGRSALRGIGVGFGGPVDDARRTVIKSHQIDGWDDFPLADWIGSLVEAAFAQGREDTDTDRLRGSARPHQPDAQARADTDHLRGSAHLPTVLGNDADVAGLAEALFGAGKGLSPVFYITIGSGIGGGLIVDGQIQRGCGRGAAEIGHLRLPRTSPSGLQRTIVEETASGWGLETEARRLGPMRGHEASAALRELIAGDWHNITARHLAVAAAADDPFAWAVLRPAWETLAEAICLVIALVCPRRFVIGGGVSLMGEKVLFEPLRKLVAERVFRPFADCCDIVPAALGEEVVVHGALALARTKLA